MVDQWQREKRSRLMARVRQKDTVPELAVRRGLHRAGLRFRLHRKDLPGTPDLILPKYRTAVFVHGCFWHGHDCRKGRRPSSNIRFWTPKLDRNARRDQEAQSALIELGWQVATIWECDVDAGIEQLLGQLQSCGPSSDDSK